MRLLLVSLASLAALPQELVPLRVWLDRFTFLVPGDAATRWLLLADLACLVALGAATRWPWAGVPAAVMAGFLALNLAGMVLTDFYLGLTVFHFGVGLATAVLVPGGRWLGVALVALALGLGVLT
jgi:hypothetical protein